MKSIICIFASVLALNFISCNKEEVEPISGMHEVNYYFYQYFVPSTIVRSPFSSSDYLVLYLTNSSQYSIITLENKPTEYLKLALEYGETGERKFWIDAQPSKPYNISGLKVFQQVQDSLVDASDSIDIMYWNAYQCITSGYSNTDRYYQQTTKRVSELTDFDLKWFSADFDISISDTTKQHILTITLSDGTEISKKLN